MAWLIITKVALNTPVIITLWIMHSVFSTCTITIGVMYSFRTADLINYLPYVGKKEAYGITLLSVRLCPSLQGLKVE
jgi:hypothetical protein